MDYFCNVARVLSALLFISYIFTATEFRQLFKVRSLLHHYAEHKTAIKAITFFDFLYMHYAGDDFINSDQSEDMELPFKKFDDVSPFSLFAEASPPLQIQKDFFKASNWIRRNKTRPVSYFPNPIWQPPRIC
jgi:hypothetical protein